MKYLSLDIETTGLLTDEGASILSLGVIVEDTEKMTSYEEALKFYGVVKKESITGNLFALAMNAELLKEISSLKIGDTDVYRDEFDLIEGLALFIKENELEGSILAGKNLALFDLPFMQKYLEQDVLSYLGLNRRVLDIGSLFFTPEKVVPNLKTCLEITGIKKEISHHALDDAWDVILCERFKRRNLVDTYIQGVQVDCSNLSLKHIQEMITIVNSYGFDNDYIDFDNSSPFIYFMYCEDGYFTLSTYEKTYELISFEEFVKRFKK